VGGLAYSLGWQVDDEFAVSVPHCLLPPQQAGFEDILNHVEGFRILVEKGHRDEAVGVRSILPEKPIPTVTYLRKNL
jgi:hypothetical protein